VKLLRLKYLTLFIILLFSLEISRGQINHSIKETGEITLNRCSDNDLAAINCLNLELRENESVPINHGEKVETIVITCPLTNYSEIRLNNPLTFQKIAFSKRNNFIILHCSLLITETLQISPLVNILRI
jgi:hypothetical protein